MGELAPMIDVTSVRVVAGYLVELSFADGAVRTIDLEALLWGPMFEPMRADLSGGTALLEGQHCRPGEMSGPTP